MNMKRFGGKRVVVPTIAAVVALGIGGVMWGSAAHADLGEGERDRVGQAAVQAVGGGTVLEVESSDDAGEAYEVEIRKADGTEQDIALDKDLKVVNQAGDAGKDGDDRAMTSAERAQAEAAALTAVPGGTVTDVEASDETGAAYEVEVRGADKTEWEVRLDSAFKVLGKATDD